VIVRQVAGAVSKQFQVPVSELKGSSRQQAIAEARAVAMTLCRRLTNASYAEIGRYFSDRDHTTVLHACRKIEALAAQDAATARLLEELSAQITADQPRG
jgi:chromosomal replication initiator protein